MTTSASLRHCLVAQLVESSAIQSDWVRTAFSSVPREIFVPRYHRAYPAQGLIDGSDPPCADEWIDAVYTDQVLVVQYAAAADGGNAPTSSSSQPTVMAGMLEALELEPHHRVLEIGTGTGYNAALLCQRVGSANVTSIELDPALADAACAALASIGLSPTVYAGDGAAPLPQAGRFDRIIATAATDHIPAAWINQLAPGGAIVADLRGGIAGSLVRLAALEADETVETVQGWFLRLPGAFMPMRTHPARSYRDGEEWDTIVYDQQNPQCTTTQVSPVLVAQNPSLRFVSQLHLAGRRLRFYGLGTHDTALDGRAIDGSWFSADVQPDSVGHHKLRQGGPQRLWDSVEAAYATWQRLGKPDIDQFGVTAHDDPSLQCVWFKDPDSWYRWPLPL
jgi:protein-L-isoaspartate O-methyltransferase